jgi:hypothetical protein
MVEELRMKSHYWMAQAALKWRAQLPWHRRRTESHAPTNDGAPAKIPLLRELLSTFVDAGFSVQRLTQLAHMKIGAVWNDLSSAELLELDNWLKAQQMTTMGRAQIEWTYIRATFASIQQEHGPADNIARRSASSSVKRPSNLVPAAARGVP